MSDINNNCIFFFQNEKPPTWWKNLCERGIDRKTNKKTQHKQPHKKYQLKPSFFNFLEYFSRGYLSALICSPSLAIFWHNRVAKWASSRFASWLNSTFTGGTPERWRVERRNGGRGTSEGGNVGGRGTSEGSSVAGTPEGGKSDDRKSDDRTSDPWTSASGRRIASCDGLKIPS